MLQLKNNFYEQKANEFFFSNAELIVQSNQKRSIRWNDEWNGFFVYKIKR